MPTGIQRSRKKGWIMPEGAIYVGRPSPYGNPFRIGEVRKMPDGSEQFTTADNCMEWFEEYLDEVLFSDPNFLDPLRGHDLVCWCHLANPCHRNILLRRANGCGNCQTDVPTPHDMSTTYPTLCFPCADSMAQHVNDIRP